MSLAKERAKLRLKSDIINYQFPPGKKLRVNELAELYDVGLSPMREAIIALSSEGFVEYKTHLGGFVSDLTWREFSESVSTASFILTQLLADREYPLEAAKFKKAKTLVTELSHALLETPLSLHQIDRIEQLYQQFLLTLTNTQSKTISHQLLQTILGVLSRYRRLFYLKTRNYNPMIDIESLFSLLNSSLNQVCHDNKDVILRAVQPNTEQMKEEFSLKQSDNHQISSSSL
ncbi:GntR family transcriptional regulator [Vibrio barjaei]|uniref:GntR family transcriptional regulator n=1 Tax=Vibrio barjaei TaxID=1676683 RepID=A0ABW7INQ7_9VIBR